jgi:hypothetical protein
VSELLVTEWDNNKSGFSNIYDHILADSINQGNINRQIKEGMNLIPSTNGLMGTYDLKNYLNRNYGTRKPKCLLEKIWEAIEDFVEWVIELVEDIGRFVEEVVEDVMDGVGDIVDGALEIVGEVADIVVDVVQAVIVEPLEQLGDAVGDLFDEILDVGK